jgi:hypothetical protein
MEETKYYHLFINDDKNNPDHKRHSILFHLKPFSRIKN